MSTTHHRKVVVTDIAWASLEVEAAIISRIGATATLLETGTADELMSVVGDADAIMTCWAPVPGAALVAGERLRIVSRYGIGLDNIDVGEASRQGILVTNVPDYCLDEVAEHAMAMVLSLGRRLGFYDDRTRAGLWGADPDAPLQRMRGSRLGIVGFGNIGRALARRARAMGMEVLVCDPYVSEQAISDGEYQSLALPDLLQASDFVSLTLPLNPETRHLIGEAELRQMKPTAYLVNTSRGPIVDLDALVLAVREGWIAGAGLDVFEPEPLPPSHPLFSLPEVLATPHVAYHSAESQLDLRTRAAENVVAVLSGRMPESIVDPAVLDLPRWSHLV